MYEDMHFEEGSSDEDNIIDKLETNLTKDPQKKEEQIIEQQ